MPLELGCCAGSASWINDHLEAWGFDWIRQDVLSIWPDQIALMIGRTIRPLWLLKSTEQPDVLDWLVIDSLERLGDQWALEITNEPDLAPDVHARAVGQPDWSHHPEAWAATVCRTLARVRQLGFTGPVLAGAISNLNDRGMAYAQRAWSLLPDDIAIGFHRYPPYAEDRTSAYPPAATRTEELQAIRRLANKRPLWLTEWGYTQAPYRHWNGIPPYRHVGQLTNEECAAFITADLQLYEQERIAVACWYQYTDGPSLTEDLDRFGLVTADGHPKEPQVEAFCR